jgi:hypothetical protein
MAAATPQSSETRVALDTLTESMLVAYAVLADAAESQWQSGSTPTLREDTTERSKGMTSDPVAYATMDERRLALRAAVKATEHSLVLANKVLRAVIAHLKKALAAEPAPTLLSD